MVLQITPVVNEFVRSLCLSPYRGHPKGCPNFGCRKTCLPHAPLFDRVFDLSQPVWAIVNRFDLASHVARMRSWLPEWSEFQLRCCLYWQATARRELMAKIRDFIRAHPGCSVTACPEAMGVDVTATLAGAGIVLEWPPVNWVYQVAFAAYRKAGDTAGDLQVAL